MAEPQWARFQKEAAPGQKLDFQVRVHVIEARELQPRDKTGMSDPVCFVEVLNQKKNTITHKKTTICTWDHLMFWELNLTPEEFFMGKITLRVFDANTLMRNVEIGSYQFDIGSIYEHQGHELFRQWVALSDQSGKFNGVQGYLRLSVTVLGPKDVAPAHSEEEEFADEAEGTDLQSMILMPPTIQTQEHSLQLSIFQGEDLPKMDTFGKCDGFVVAKFAGNPEIQTEVVKNSYSPAWNEKFSIPVRLPTMTDLIKVQLRDWDGGSKDDMIGTVFLKFSDINAGTTDWKKPRWVNFYGIPGDVNATGATKEAIIAKKMLGGFIEGSAYRGRVLMAMESNLSPGAKLIKTNVSAAREPATMNSILRVELLEASELQTDSDVSIEVSIGKYSKDSKKADVKNGSASWYQSIDDISAAFPTDLSQVPDIFINVYKHSLGSKKRMGYIRMKASEISNDKPAEWVLIQPDILGSVKEDQIVGFLQFKVQFGDKLGQRAALAKPTFKKYHLRAHIYQARDLISGDENGASDPYAVVRVGKFSAKTKTVKSTLFPSWYETLTMDVELPDQLSMAPDVNIMVFDWDQFTTNDVLGRFSLPIASLDAPFIDVPTWHPLYITNPNNTEGAVLASFQLIPAADVSKYPVPHITPEMIECTLEIAAVGLRGLLPSKLLPVQNAFVEFDCGTEVKVRTKTSDRPSGANPNHLEILQLPVRVPKNPLFAPPINIRVIDDRKVYNTLLGTRSLSLANFIPGKKKPATEELGDDITVVDEIPGAKFIKKEQEAKVENGKEEVPDQVALDIIEDKDPNQGLLAVTDAREGAVLDSKMKLAESMGKKDWESEESVPQGAELVAEAKTPERETIKHEMETEMQSPPFATYKIFRAKNKQRIQVGEWKGHFKLVSKNQVWGTKEEEESTVDLVKLFKPRDYVVRVYVIEGYQLVPQDADGSNNPYVRVSTIRTTIKDLKEQKQNTSRPQFFKCYEVNCAFPTETVLDVGIWDYDKVGSDDMIGSTRIDLETRVLSKEWQATKMKPFEYRTLWNPCSSNPQGQIKLWVDIMTPEEAKSTPPEPLAPPAPLEYELRAIIWEVKNVALKDIHSNAAKNMSDIFCSAYPAGSKPQFTDTHWRSKDGTGSFNWRMKFPLTLPVTIPRFKIQLWDRDYLNPNDAIAEANLNLRTWFAKVHAKKLERDELPKQWLSLTHPSFSGPQGEVNVSLELVSASTAASKPNGFGRDEPNDFPVLAEPDRPEDSFPAWRLDKVASQLVWGQYKYYIIGAITCVVCTILFILIIYLATIF